MRRVLCFIFGHSYIQHTYGSGITYTGEHCRRCKEGLRGREGIHGYKELMLRKH